MCATALNYPTSDANLFPPFHFPPIHSQDSDFTHPHLHRELSDLSGAEQRGESRGEQRGEDSEREERNDHVIHYLLILSTESVSSAVIRIVCVLI